MDSRASQPCTCRLDISDRAVRAWWLKLQGPHPCKTCGGHKRPPEAKPK